MTLRRVAVPKVALGLLVLSGLLLAAKVEFSLDCVVNFDQHKADDIFDGVGSSDVRFQITMDTRSPCDGMIRCVTGAGAADFGPVAPGKSKTISCPGTAANPVTDVFVWCRGTHDKCRGSWEPVR